MIVESITGIYLPLLKFEVRVQSLLLRPSSRKMLGHTGNRTRSQRFALKAEYVSPGQPGGKLRILAEGTTDTGPTRLSCQVDLGMKGHAHANGQVLLPRDIGKAAHQLLITDGPKTQRLTPLGEFDCLHGKYCTAEMIPGIGGDGNRYTQPAVFRFPLHGIVTLCQSHGGRHLPKIEMVHLQVAD